MISNWRSQGYTVKLFYLRLPMVDMAIERVKQRVLVGGHNVPEDVVRRRFEAGLKNFEKLYKPIVDEWVLYDNAGEQPLVIEKGYNHE